MFRKTGWFESLFNKLEDYPELETMLRDLLLCGKDIPYVVGGRSIEAALMFGYVIELKVGRGSAYHERGEARIGKKVLIEAVV